MKTLLIAACAALTLSACAQKSAYELGVEEFEPRYCYQSIGGVSCYETPYHRDERRMVNYYGPAPVRYDRPEPAPDPVRSAPEQIDYWVKDPEPIPTISPKGDLADRPWLSETAVQAPQQPPQQSGLAAFLRDIHLNATSEPVPEPTNFEAQTF